MQYSIVKHGRRLPLSTPALDAHSTLFSSKLCAVSPAATELSPSPLSSRPPRASPADRALLPEGLALGLIPFYQHPEIWNNSVSEPVFGRRSPVQRRSPCTSREAHAAWIPTAPLRLAACSFLGALWGRGSGVPTMRGGSAGRRAGTRGSVWHL